MRKLAIFSAAFAAAVVIYVYVIGDARAVILAGACLLLSLFCSRPRLKRCALAFVGAAAAFLWCFAYQTVFLPDKGPALHTEQTVTLRICDTPTAVRQNTSVFCEIDGEKAILYGPDAFLKLQVGDVITCRAVVEETGIRPGGEEKLYYSSHGIMYKLQALSEPTVEYRHVKWHETVRLWLQARIDALFNDDTGAFLRAVLTGDRSRLDYATRNTLSVAGISHTVAVSGMHVTMLLAFLSVLCGKNPHLTAVIGIPLVIAFALMTGASASVCRAAAMQILLLSAPLLGREPDGPTSLGTAALVLLACNPWAVADVSFQLSFAAVAGLMLFSSPIQKKILSLRKTPGKILKAFASGVAATLGATITTLPLTVVYFGTVSIAAVFTNLLCLWAVTAVFTLGLLACVLGALGTVLAWPVSVLVSFILGTCRLVAAVPFAAAYPANPALMVWAICTYVLFIVLLLSKRKLPVWWIMSGITAAFLLCLFIGKWNLARGELTFTAVDVGQGQCLILHSGDFTAVIDCGGSDPDDSGEEAARALHSAGITQVDVLILTHYDEDHVGGVPQLLRRVTVGEILLPDMESQARNTVEQTAAGNGTDITVVSRETLVTFANGFLRIFAGASEMSGNEGSLCVLAKTEKCDILVTGDRSVRGELDLLSRWNIPQVDILVAGHHGAADSTSQLLLEQTRPGQVIISVEKGNAFGHPAPEVLERIAHADAEVLRTDLHGTVTVVK